MTGAPAGPFVLIVDDEASIREPLSEYLEANGIAAALAGGVPEARQRLGRDTFDLVLLDIMMPGEDGLTLLREIQNAGGPPVILLTAKTDDTDRIVGLEIGADDYVTKPFNPRELLARVRAVIRRGGGRPPPAREERAPSVRFRFEGYVLDSDARTLTGPEGELVLTGGEYELLLALVERAGRILGREQLLDLTQGRSAHLFDRSIDNQISRLRKKIERDPKAPRIVKTVRGGGYVCAAKVETG